MPAPRKYPDELRDRAQRLVAEAMSEDSSLSLNAAVKRIAPKVGVVPDTLRGWVRRVEIDEGRRPGTTSADAASIKTLQAEVRELKRANEILLAASSYVGDRCQAGVSSSLRRRLSYTSRRPVWPLTSASSRWAWIVGRCSMVVKKKVQDSQMVSYRQSSSMGRPQ